MRRSRQKLTVNTFPFLAVLLCAMGSLILLLIVMDRRAKVVASNKVALLQDARRKDHADKIARAGADRQADWERQRDNLHQLLLAQKRELREHLLGLDAERGKADQHLQKHQAQYRSLSEQVAQQYQRLLATRQELAQRKAGLSVQDKQEAASRGELDRLALELLQLEKTVRDLKELKTRPSEAFSLIPYRGRNGDKRQPIYIECTLTGLVFHPGGKVLQDETLTPMHVRAEVSKTAGALAREQEPPPGRMPLTNQNAYILFLVRPDGIDNYQKATAALAGYAIDYGYELVEAQWAFDFSHLNPPGSTSVACLEPRLPRPPRGVGGFPAPPGSGVGDGPPGAHVSGSSPIPRGPGTPLYQGKGPPGTAGGPGGRMAPGMRVLAGSPPTGMGMSVLGAQGPASESSVLAGAASSTGLPKMQGPPSGSPSGSASPGAASAQGTADPGGQAAEPPSVLAQVLPPSGLNLTGRSGRPGRTVPPGTNFLIHEPNPEGNADLPPANPGTSNSGNPNPSVQLSLQTPGQPGSPAGNSEGREPQSTGDAASSSSRPAGKSPSLGSSLFFGGTSDGAKGGPAPTLGRLLSNHDFVINLECLGEGVVLYPRNELYPINPVANQRNVEASLVHAIQQMIARKQATVRAGETQYRPMIRLQIQPEGRRTYYWIYPVLEGLRLPMIRENLEE